MTGTINDSDNAMETGSRVRIKRDGQMPVSKLPPVPSHLFGDGVGKGSAFCHPHLETHDDCARKARSIVSRAVVSPQRMAAQAGG